MWVKAVSGGLVRPPRQACQEGGSPPGLAAPQSHLRVRKNSDIHVLRRFDQAIHRIARQRQPPRPPAVADEDLRNPMFAGKTDDLGYRIRSLQNMDFGAELARHV